IPFDEGWSVTVNGKPRKLHRVNIGFTGLLLEPGKHDIVLKYSLPFIKTSLLITFFGLVLFVVLLIIDRKFRLIKINKELIK
ncbi:MAG: YfhO family protein, partial [bacterium]